MLMVQENNRKTASEVVLILCCLLFKYLNKVRIGASDTPFKGLISFLVIHLFPSSSTNTSNKTYKYNFQSTQTELSVRLHSQPHSQLLADNMPAAPSHRDLQKMEVEEQEAPVVAQKAKLAPGQIPTNERLSFGGETLTINLDLTVECTKAEIDKLHDDVELYAVYTKTVLVAVTLPEYQFDYPKSDHHYELFYLVSALNKFTRLSRCEVTFRSPHDNFTQLTNVSNFYRLNFRGWKLFRKIGAENVEQIYIGSRTDRRLNAWYQANIAGSLNSNRPA